MGGRLRPKSLTISDRHHTHRFGLGPTGHPWLNGAMSDSDSVIKKRSVIIAGHKTSVSLEAAFWDALKRVARSRGCTINDLVAEIDGGRAGNLSSAIRVFVLKAGVPGT